MKTVFSNFFGSLPGGARLLILAYAFGFPLACLGHITHSYDLCYWMALSPETVWSGEVWRLVSYAFLPLGIVDWVVSLFWLATLVSVIGRNWSVWELWGYCLLATLAGALPFAAFRIEIGMGLVGNGAMIFALLAAWYRLYGRERLILLGIGEISVRQAAVLVAVIEILVMGFCVGWLVTLAMLCGGLAGWLYLLLRGKHVMSRRGQVVNSERVARLEL